MNRNKMTGMILLFCLIVVFTPPAKADMTAFGAANSELPRGAKIGGVRALREAVIQKKKEQVKE